MNPNSQNNQNNQNPQSSPNNPNPQNSPNIQNPQNPPTSPKTFLPNHGHYRNLRVYAVTEIIYDITYYFAHRYLQRGDRTVDQMIQAARSGKQNIAEGNQAAATSSETEIKLTNVAKQKPASKNSLSTTKTTSALATSNNGAASIRATKRCASTPVANSSEPTMLKWCNA